MDYLDNVLIKLKRHYSKDEVVAALSKKLSEAEVKNGVLLDEIHSLKAHLSRLQSEEAVLKRKNKSDEKRIRKERQYQDLMDKVYFLNKELEKCRSGNK